MPERFSLYMHEEAEGKAQRGQAEKIRFFLVDVGYKYENISVNAEEFAAMVADGTLVTGTLPMLEDSKTDTTYEGSNSIMRALAGLANSEQAFRGQNKYLGVDRVKTGAGAEYATNLRAEAMATDMAVSDDWIKKNFTQLETYLKADDEENYRCILTNTDYAYITIFELINAIVEKNSTSCLDGFRILSEFHEKLAKTARFEKHITSR